MMDRVRAIFVRHNTGLTVAALILLTVVALRTMNAGFYRLVWEAGRPGAIDLKYFHTFATSWCAGQPIYQSMPAAVYPPASYIILWPLLGWLPVPVARWCWAALMVLALVGLIRLLIQASGAATTRERVFLTLLVLGSNAVGVCVGNGQLILFLMPVLLLALLLVARGPVDWRRDLLAAVLFLVTLVKPSVSAPFFWLMIVLPRRLRPAILVVLGYAALTLAAATFQEAGLPLLLRDWLWRGSTSAAPNGYGHLQILLAGLGLRSWMFPASLVILMALGIWCYRQRDADVWLLLGVTGIVARVWAYHRVYDDVLLMLPLITLYRLAKHHGVSTNPGGVAAGLCGLLSLTLIAPGPWHNIAPPWRDLYDGFHVGTWLAALGYLLLASARRTAVPSTQNGSSD